MLSSEDLTAVETEHLYDTYTGEEELFYEPYSFLPDGDLCDWPEESRDTSYLAAEDDDPQADPYNQVVLNIPEPPLCWSLWPTNSGRALRKSGRFGQQLKAVQNGRTGVSARCIWQAANVQTGGVVHILMETSVR